MKVEEQCIPSVVRRLMKDATENELFEATDNLRQYLRAMYALYDAIDQRQADGDSRKSGYSDRFELGASELPQA